MKKMMALLAGLSLMAGTAFAADATTTKPAFTTGAPIKFERPTTGTSIKPEFHITPGAITEGAIKPPRPEGTTEGAIKPPRPEGTTGGAIKPERPEGTTEGAIKPERPEGTTEGAIKPERPEGTTGSGIRPPKTTGGAIEFEKGKAYGHQRDKNPVAEMNINKVKPAELTEEQKTALKAQFEAIKAAKEAEEGKNGKKGKFGKIKK